MRRALEYFPIGLFAVAVGVYVFVHVRGWAAGPIVSDGYNYYVYLPDWFIHHDFTLDAVARDCCGGEFLSWTGIRRWPGNGHWINLHPIGTAVLIAPFFLAADALTRWSNLPRDGFSLYYQHFVGLAGITYMTVAIALLARLLSRRFSPGVVLATLVSLIWGTNLFHYGAYDPAFSHIYAFFLLAALLTLTDAWWRSPTLAPSIGIGAVGALIVLVRHTDALFLLVIPLYGVRNLRTATGALQRLWQRRSALLVSALAFAVVVSPQLLLYKLTTGHWIVKSYPEISHFEFGSPHLAGVLFSVQKGLFFWSPVLLLAVFGALVARGWAVGIRLAATVIFAVHTYLIASWFDWQFGASFGHRAFIDALPLGAVFLASGFDYVSKRPRVRAIVGIAVALAIALSCIEMVQYWIRILPMEDTTWAQYRALFLRFR